MCLSLYTIEFDASILQVMWVQHMVSTERQEPQSAQPHREPGLRFHVEKSLHFASGGALLRVALELPRGQWLAVLGPSGAGKTSLLRMLAGLTQPDLCWLQQQRLALARALATKSRLLLLDEPLSSLDTDLRGEMQELLLDDITGRTVTASLDIYNAVLAGDFERAAVMSIVLGGVTVVLFVLLRQHARQRHAFSN